jgi:hypothetical protein
MMSLQKLAKHSKMGSTHTCKLYKYIRRNLSWYSLNSTITTIFRDPQAAVLFLAPSRSSAFSSVYLTPNFSNTFSTFYLTLKTHNFFSVFLTPKTLPSPLKTPYNFKFFLIQRILFISSLFFLIYSRLCVSVTSPHSSLSSRLFVTSPHSSLSIRLCVISPHSS